MLKVFFGSRLWGKGKQEAKRSKDEKGIHQDNGFGHHPVGQAAISFLSAPNTKPEVQGIVDAGVQTIPLCLEIKFGAVGMCDTIARIHERCRKVREVVLLKGGVSGGN